MSTAARSTTSSTPVRPIESESLVPAAHAHDLIAENTQLRRDLSAARVRNRTFERALFASACASKVVGVVPGRDREHEYTMIYETGVRVERRWTEVAGWHDHQVASATDSVAAKIDALFAGAPGPCLASEGMAVLEDDDSPLPTSLAAKLERAL